MCVRSVLHRLKQLFIEPKRMWADVRQEERTTEEAYSRWIAGFAAFSALSGGAAFLVAMLKARGMLVNSGDHINLLGSLISHFVINLVFVAVVALATSEMAGAFSGKRSIARATRMIGYAVTPLWLASALAVPTVLAISYNGQHWFWDAGVAGLWAAGSIMGSGYFVLLILYGVREMMECDAKKVLPYTFAITFTSVVVQALLWLAESGAMRFMA